MKVVCIHHRLAGFTSHHFNEAQGLQRELRRRGVKLALLVNKIAEPRVAAALKARAVLDDPTFRLEWSFAERSARFLQMLHREAGPLVKRDDWVLVPVVTQLEAHALVHWLQELPDDRKPWLVFLFLSDRWNRAGGEEQERQLAELRELRSAIAGLSTQDAPRLLIGALTDVLAGELSELLGTRVVEAPMPQDYTHFPPAALRAWTKPCVGIFGGTRREKGSHLLPEIIAACRARMPMDFIVQLTNNTLTPEEVAHLESIAEQPGVSVIRDAPPPREYAAAFGRADLFLFPYERIPYRARTSGVFGEAAAIGRPAVVTAGTWMARQVESGRVAGIVAADLQPESIADAIAECVARYDELRRHAEAVREDWRRTVSIPAFVDFMEAHLPRRRGWWPF